MPYVQVDETVSVFYEDWGEGNKYLFTSEIYIDYHAAYTRELVKRGYHLIAVQIRGYGKSSRVPQADDMQNHWVPDLLKVADHIGAEKFAYTGNSHGCILGWQLLRLHPERILAFAGVVTGPSIRGGKQTQAGSDARVKDAARAATDEGWRERCEENRQSSRFQERVYTGDYWREQLRTRAEYEYGHNMALDLQERGMNFGRDIEDGLDTEEKLIEWMKTVKTPVILFGGMKDAIIAPEAMFRTARCIPHCKLVLYQDSGHGVRLSHGEDLTAEIDRFFQERRVFEGI